ncbi:hypothetical protein D1614_22460 [Maribellus luteus]|uniref:Uncharacterized protein n=1 Tax=Maribellus luteus TaxID=2305463 RepID=A0A399SNH2_9BACT|nr:hypothetical protein D1614_22460 [Maribellus luteus]
MSETLPRVKLKLSELPAQLFLPRFGPSGTSETPKPIAGSLSGLPEKTNQPRAGFPKARKLPNRLKTDFPQLRKTPKRKKSTFPGLRKVRTGTKTAFPHVRKV